jgi:hypothetical protein
MSRASRLCVGWASSNKLLRAYLDFPCWHIDGKTVSELSDRCVPSAGSNQIVIDGHDPLHYKQAA